MLPFWPNTKQVVFLDMTVPVDAVPDLLFQMRIDFNEKVGRRACKEDREFAEWVDLGGEG